MKKATFHMFFCFLLLSLFGSSVASYAAEKIVDVKFDQVSSYKLPEEMLLMNIQLRPGSEFNEKILNEDIKRLYSTGYFSDVVVETSKNGDGVKLTFKLSAKDRVNSIIFKGNIKFPEEKLKDKVNIVTGSPLKDKELRESLANLRDYYKNEGYNDAIISPKISKSVRPGFVDVIFEINENLRLKVNSVSFDGNTIFSSWWTLREAVATQHSYLSWILDFGLLDREELGNDKARLRALYWNKGYLDFKVKKIEVKPEEDDPEYVDVTFILDEGKPYKVGEVRISGNKRFPETELIELLKQKKGNTYDHRLAIEDIQALQRKYFPLGYADFICREIRVPDYESHTVDIDYRIVEGKIYNVRDINISGNRITKDYVIRRELPIQPGEPLDNNKVELGKSRLMGLGYFEKVDTVNVGTDIPTEKDVEYRVKEKQTAQVKVGGGWSDSDSLVGMLELSESNFDITDPENYFRGGGQRIRLKGMVGLKRWDVMFNFSEPWLFGIPLKFDLNAFHHTRWYDKWKEQRTGFDTSLTHRIFDDFTSLSLAYRFEYVRVYGMDEDLSQELLDEEGSDLVGALGLNINRDTRDNVFEPCFGYELNGLAEVTSQLLGASSNYYRLEAKGIYYYSLFNKAIRMHAGGKLGVVGDFGGGRVPIYERYFLGGGNSLRGFPYRKVSPVDKNNDTIGGNSMFLLTAEVSHPIYKYIRGAVFVDAGGSWLDSWSFDLDQFNVGAGYGLRVNIPQIKHPVRFDLAYPILNNQKGLPSKIRFHFNVGFTW